MHKTTSGFPNTPFVSSKFPQHAVTVHETTSGVPDTPLSLPSFLFACLGHFSLPVTVIMLNNERTTYFLPTADQLPKNISTL